MERIIASFVIYTDYVCQPTYDEVHDYVTTGCFSAAVLVYNMNRA